MSNEPLVSPPFTDPDVSSPEQPTTEEPTTRSRRWYLLGPLGLALVFAVGAQWVFDPANPASVWNGVALALVAVIFFAVAVISANDTADLMESSADVPLVRRWLRAINRFVQQAVLRSVALSGSLLITMGLLHVLRREPPLESYNWALLPWLGAIGLFLFVAAPANVPTLLRIDWRVWWQEHGRLTLAVGAIGLVTAVLRIWQIADIPPTLGGDEAEQGLEAIRVLNGEITNPFSTGWLGVPTMQFYFSALLIGPLGDTIFALRLPWALIGTASVLAVFLLVQRLQGTLLALVTAALLATYHFHLHFSRLGSHQIADVLFVALALLFLYRGYDNRQPLNWALSGIIIGLAQYFYAGARFTAILAAAMLIFFALRDGLPFIRTRYREYLALIGGFLITAAPMIQLAIRDPDTFNARLNQVGIIQSGWLEREVGIRGQSELVILFDQLQRALLAFNVYPDKTFWYGSPEPFMDTAMGILFILGAGFALLNLWDRRIFPMVAWWGGATVLGGALTVEPPSAMRLVTLAAPAIFFVALALVKIGEVVVQALRIQRPQDVLWPYLAAAMVLLSAGSLNWYFNEFTPLLRYGNHTAVIATHFGKYADANFEDGTQVFFFGPPTLYVGFGTIRYLAPDIQGVDINDPIPGPFDRAMVQPGTDLAFVFLSNRFNEYELVKQTFPNGELITFESPVPERTGPLYHLYLVPSEQVGG
ncbi:MAG: glycosyltransferase family 39 protein [Chloroflexaceae bacterium]|nr:glycosyltransferase family 39 protein [Chloroflexaceae bacterium]